MDFTRKLQTLLTREPLETKDGVLDFIGNSSVDYCGNWGEQWNRFRTIQVDSVSGKTESWERFFSETGWSQDDLKGKLLLDAGCGAGRFAEIALECGARVIAVDISEAAYACRKTLERFPAENWLVLRASILELPVTDGVFDGVYSIGVLQSTPDPQLALGCLARLLAPGGRLSTWILEQWAPIANLLPKQWIHFIVAQWPVRRKVHVAYGLTALFFPLGWALSWFGRTGERLSYLLPYAARHHYGRGNLRRQWDYSVMDTLDWYGPVYENCQTEEDVVRVMKRAGLKDVRRLESRGMAITGVLPRPFTSHNAGLNPHETNPSRGRAHNT